MSVETIWNHPILFIMSSIIIGYMILQSLLFMKMGYKEALNLGVEKHTLNNIIKNRNMIRNLNYFGENCKGRNW